MAEDHSVRSFVVDVADAELDGIVFDPRYEKTVVALNDEAPLRTIA